MFVLKISQRSHVVVAHTLRQRQVEASSWTARTVKQGNPVLKNLKKEKNQRSSNYSYRISLLSKGFVLKEEMCQC